MSEIVDALLTQWTAFKSENDKAIAELKKNGSIAAETATKVDRLNDQVSDLEARLNRPKVEPSAPTQDEGVKSYKAWMRTGIMNAAMQEGTTTEGGYTVPVPMYAEIVRGLQEVSLFRAAGAKVVPMTRWKMDVPTLTNSTAAVLTNEEGGVSQVEPTVGTVQAVAYKYTKLSKASKELAADSQFDLWGNILSGDFVQAFAKAENAAFSTGSGSSQPQGLTYGGTSAATTASATAIIADEVIDCFYALDERHAAVAKWMMARATAKIIRKLKDDQDQYLWAQGFSGEPPTLMGRPVIINSSMPAATAGLKPLVIGDFSYFWIFERQMMELQRLVELYAGNGQIGYLADKRFDSHVMLATAFYYLTMHA